MEKTTQNQDNSSNKNIWLLGWTSLINDLSSEMIMPILPMFFAHLGADGFVIGILGGLREGIGNLLKILFGYASDKIGRRKPFLLGGYISSALMKLLLAFSSSWPMALIVASLERIGKGMRNAPRDAMIVETMPNQEGKGFGIHRMMDTTGAILGSSIVFFLVWKMSKIDYMHIILFSSAIAFLSVIPLFTLKEPENKKTGPNDVPALAVGLKKLSKKARRFILISSLFALGSLSYMFFIMRIRYTSISKTGILFALGLYIFFNIVYAIFSVPLGLLFDKIGGRRTIMMGYIAMLSVVLGFAFFHPFMSWILFALYGFSMAALKGNQNALIGIMAEPNERGLALGTFQTLTGIAMILGNSIAGFLWKAYGIKWAFLFSSVSIILAIILMIFSWRLLNVHNFTGLVLPVNVKLSKFKK